MINSETPYKSEAIEVLKKDNINANKYAIDRTALKIYYSKYSGNNIRIDFWDYVFLWSEEAIEDLKNNIKNGYKEANDNAGLLIKSSMNRLKGILP
ncbi:hypothetical protein [Clostridium polynesiense]|uniref:hypothetical protein n=1 Tax=Clostridium polynesiense TaxID=1325933 RepID=UPI00058B31E0|nr:hypothetical protein [Clostridium polynesiense]